jgi:hypothetical protein
MIHISKGSDKFNFLNIVVDTGVPGRWREPVWYARIKKMAAVGHDHNLLVRVQVGRRSWMILPHQDEIEIPNGVTKFDITENAYGVRRIKFFTGDQTRDKSPGLETGSS